MQPFDPDAEVCVASASCHPAGDRWTLVFSRPLEHDVHRVWAGLTDPALLAGWAPAVPDQDLGVLGRTGMTARAAGPADRHEVQVTVADRPRVLAYASTDDDLRWELADHAAGVLVTLRHTFLEPDWACDLAAAWHLHLDALDRLLGGCPGSPPESAPGSPPQQLRLAYGEQLARSASISDRWPG